MSEDVSKFLLSIKELGDRRAEEDAARSRELEEQILQDRRERQARRAERARSISPQKSSPANTPPPPSHRPTGDISSSFVSLDGPSESPLVRSAARKSESLDSTGTTTALDHSTSTSPSKENDSPFFDFDTKRSSATALTSPSNSIPPASASTSASAVSRGSPLSWQRRPTSQSSDRPRSRPLSMVATENAAARKSVEPADHTPPYSTSAAADHNSNPSKDQIAQALASKDPTWFRQTPDRGVGSAAYRRSQVEDEDRHDPTRGSAQLPGMTRELPTPGEPVKLVTAPRSSPPAGHGKAGSPLTLTSSQRLDPPSKPSAETDAATFAHPGAVLPTGRTSPTRPISPTKGMGGFVESAMMKRSDSVKRWSVQSNTGLARAGSVVTTRGEFDRSGTPQPGPRSRPTSMLRESTSNSSIQQQPQSLSRPGSSHGNDGTMDAKQASSSSKEAEPPAVSIPARDEETPPSSPSKTMDPRRWSPTKASSWLETALNKPAESPKPKAAPPSGQQQPSWMVELNKAKAQKAAGGSASDPSSGRAGPSYKHEVNVGGLLRSTKPAGGALTGAYSSSSTAATATATRGVSGSSFRSSASKSSVESAAPISSSTGDKKDFRTNLKAGRPAGAEPSGKDGEDLKSVMGNLRRTRTQNFVAPDEFKDNILRGKNALNLTGGPKPREKKDELRDAILKKKEEFKKAQTEGRGIPRGVPNPSQTADKPLPEGLAKRMELAGGARGSVSSVGSGRERDSTASVAAIDSPGLATLNSSTRSTFPDRSSVASSISAASSAPSSKRGSVDTVVSGVVTRDVATTAAAAPATPEPAPRSSALAARFNPGLAGILARGPPGMAPAAAGGSRGGGDSTSMTAAASTPPTERSKPGPQLTHMTKGRARGPKRNAPTAVASAAATPANEPIAKPAAAEVAEKPKPATTPAAASTPVRQQPQVISLVDSSKQREAESNYGTSSTSATPLRPAGNVIALVDSSKKRQDATPTSTGQRIALVDSASATPSRIKLQTVAPLEQPKLGRPSSPLKTDAIFGTRDSPVDASPGGASSRPPSPRKLDVKRMSRFLDEPRAAAESEGPDKPPQAPADKPTTSPPTKPKPVFDAQPAIAPVPSTPPMRARSPTKIGGARPLPDPTKRQQAAEPAATALGLGMGSASTVRPLALSSSPPKSLFAPLSSSSSRALPSLPPPSSPGPASPTPNPSPMRSPTKGAAEVSAFLDDFFGPGVVSRPPPPRADYYRVDAAAILTSRPGANGATAQGADAAAVKTTKAQLFLLHPDGKRMPVPAHHERVLFEREMYLCAHTYVPLDAPTSLTGSWSSSLGRRPSTVTEVYFWVGDEVPAAHVEDVQVFLTREARALGGNGNKLVRMRQGKETPGFVQALGGVAIVRRGSSNKYDSLAPHMLCGRRFASTGSATAVGGNNGAGAGLVVFDEVDFAPAALCSGFPFLATQRGRCYLWKGRGADVEELGCARLIGMDLTLTGELVEVDDGAEGDAFWRDVFGQHGVVKRFSADHWRLKNGYERYGVRLFCADAGAREQIVEISPFTQADLSPSNMYVLDAFFELYILVGSRATHQFAALRSALEFAQEYAILAAGMEDRPFVPVSTVVLGGAPRDLKAVFRKWRDDLSPTATVDNNNNRGGQGEESAGAVKRGKSLRIVPLTHALQALRE